MTSLCASARQITPTSAFSDVGMACSPSRPPRRAAVAARRSISTNYEEPYYPYYLFEADSSGEEIIYPNANGEVTDLTSESDDDAGKGEVSALFEAQATRGANVSQQSATTPRHETTLPATQQLVVEIPATRTPTPTSRPPTLTASQSTGTV
jgi:hypothetical protein